MLYIRIGLLLVFVLLRGLQLTILYFYCNFLFRFLQYT